MYPMRYAGIQQVDNGQSKVPGGTNKKGIVRCFLTKVQTNSTIVKKA